MTTTHYHLSISSPRTGETGTGMTYHDRQNALWTARQTAASFRRTGYNVERCSTGRYIIHEREPSTVPGNNCIVMKVVCCGGNCWTWQHEKIRRYA